MTPFLQERICPPRALSRRAFLGSLAACGAAALIPGLAWGRPDARRGPPGRLIDVHHHIFPPVYLAAAREKLVAQQQGPLPRAVAEWSLQATLEEMDRAVVATAVVSISTPGVWFGEVAPARRLARECNEYAARLVRDHPGRFGFFASIPLPDHEGSLCEIEYALDTLGADGIALLTSYGGRWPGDAAFAPVFEELDRRQALVYFHPTGPDCCRELMPEVPYLVAEVPHDTTRAVTSLLFSGTLARLTGIRFLFSHAGGTLPILAGRIARAATTRSELAAKVPHGVEHELRRLYYDVAASANAPAMAALMSLVPPTQVLFGSDYPYAAIDLTAGALAQLGWSDETLAAVRSDNALALMPRLRAAVQQGDATTNV